MEEQPPLWQEDVELEPHVNAPLEVRVRAACDAWIALRFHHAIGSPEETAAWTAYWDLGDQLARARCKKRSLDK
jgi:hypothetical protein